jgi:WD40 repeat protein
LVKLLSMEEGVISGVAFSPGGNRVLTGTGSSAAIVWDVGPSGDAEVANIPNASGDVTFSSSGRIVMASGLDGSLTELELDTREQTDSFGSFGPMDPFGSSHELSPDRASIAILEGTDDVTLPSLVIRDIASGNELFSLDETVAVDWSPDGRFVAVATSGWVSILDHTWRPVARFDEERSGIFNVGFGPDGVVAISVDQTEPKMKIWDWRGDEVVTEIEDTYADVINWDRSGARVATETAIWDARTGDLIVSLSVGSEDLAFSPDGSRFATGGGDGVVRLFDSSGEQLLALQGHDAVDRLVFSPDGTMLASQGDGIVRIWALEIEDLLEIAREDVTRTLTDDECRQYLHLEVCPRASST